GLGLGARCVTAGTALTPPGGPYPPHAMRHPHRYRSVSSEGRVLHERQLVLIGDDREGQARDGQAHDGHAHDGHARDGNARGTLYYGESGPLPIESWSILVLAPGVWHRYSPDPQTGWREYWVGVTGAAVESAARALKLDDRSPVRRLADPDEVTALFASILDLAPQNDAASHIGIVAEVFRMLVAVAKGRFSTRQGAATVVDRAIAIMQARVCSGLSIATIAQELDLSSSALRRRFTAETGLPPYRFLMTLKVNALKQELAHTAAPLSVLAERFAFTDQYHLSRVFRQYAGVSPSEWRRRGG
ncbi:MAG: AraC family transcriptional regulator, partial [Spirochaetaceae bacterium]